jgi:mRNA-degrading endonuclease RelE of RelBE toxin-antitoxin system
VYRTKDLKGIQKYRIGDYRVLLWVDQKERQITLYGVEHRRSVYDDI